MFPLPKGKAENQKGREALGSEVVEVGSENICLKMLPEHLIKSILWRIQSFCLNGQTFHKDLHTVRPHRSCKYEETMQEAHSNKEMWLFG